MRRPGAGNDERSFLLRHAGSRAVTPRKGSFRFGETGDSTRSIIRSAGSGVAIFELPELPHEYIDDVILVDDASQDGTCRVGRKLGVRTILHRENRENRGYVANRFLTLAEKLMLGVKLFEFHAGFRAFSRTVLEYLPLEGNSDDFVFENEILAQWIHFGFGIGEISCPARYFEEASSINFQRSAKYGFGVLATSCKFLFHRWGVRKYRIFTR